MDIVESTFEEEDTEEQINAAFDAVDGMHHHNISESLSSSPNEGDEPDETGYMPTKLDTNNIINESKVTKFLF